MRQRLVLRRARARLAAVRAAMTPWNSMVGIALVAAVLAVSTLMVRSLGRPEPPGRSPGSGASTKSPPPPAIPTAEPLLPPPPSGLPTAEPAPSDTAPSPNDTPTTPDPGTGTPTDSPTGSDAPSPTVSETPSPTGSSETPAGPTPSG